MLVMPRFVAITRTGAKSLSIARFNHEKHSTVDNKKGREKEEKGREKEEKGREKKRC